jgi:RNA polymerase sigma factor (sigma-70 family)
MVVKTIKPLVYLVDDDYSVRDALMLLIKTSGFDVQGFDSAHAFLNSYDPDRPSCLVLDVKMPVMGGLELQEELAKENIEIPIIFISGNAEIVDSASAFKAGALDFLEKPFDNQKFLTCVDDAIGKDMQSRKKRMEFLQLKKCFDSLTSREKEILQQIINSHTNKEIARLLNISPRTVEAHRSSIKKKMQGKDLAALIHMTTIVLAEDAA